MKYKYEEIQKEKGCIYIDIYIYIYIYIYTASYVDKLN